MPQISLRPVTEADFPDIRAMFADPVFLRFTRVPEPPPDGFERTWYERYEKGKADGTRRNFAVVEGPEQVFVGFAVAPSIDSEERTAELGYGITAANRGRGLATEVLRVLTAWAFDELGMFRLQLLIDPENIGSKKVAERCGYTFEGLLRSLYVKPGRRGDTESWSRLATDP